MKYIKIIIFLLFLLISSFVIYEQLRQKSNENININFINRDSNVIDIANILSIKKRVSIKDLLDTTFNITGIKILMITLNNSAGMQNSDYSKLILEKWIESNSLDDRNAIVLAIYKKNPEINFLFTDDLAYVLTDDIGKFVVENMSSNLEKADQYMKISLKEGRTNDDRYKDVIGEGIYTVLTKVKNELEKAILTVSKAEYELEKKNGGKTDTRIEKLLFDNTLILTLTTTFLLLIIGFFIYIYLKNKCPQCGSRLIKDVSVTMYPRDNSPGIKEFTFSCMVCGFSHKEKQVFFNKFFKKG